MPLLLQYLKFGTAATLSMLAGAQVVHMIYRPLDDFEEHILKAKENLKKDHDQSESKNDLNTNSETKDPS